MAVQGNARPTNNKFILMIMHAKYVFKIEIYIKCIFQFKHIFQLWDLTV